jgi:hypothetical protein
MILILFYTRKRKADNKFKKRGKWNTLERAPYSTRRKAGDFTFPHFRVVSSGSQK